MCEYENPGLWIGISMIVLIAVLWVWWEIRIFGKPGSFQRIDIEHRERHEREKRRRGEL